MAEADDPGEAAARLEAALDRIELAASRRSVPDGTEPPRGAGNTEGEPGQDTAALAARLDALIAQVRRALGKLNA